MVLRWPRVSAEGLLVSDVSAHLPRTDKNKPGLWTGIGTLLYMERTVSGDLLQSTGNSAQYSVITHMGGKSEKKWMCVCVQLNHFSVQQKLTQHNILNQLYVNKNFKKKNNKLGIARINCTFVLRSAEAVGGLFGPQVYLGEG